MSSAIRCATCGRPLDEHNRHLRFRLPEPVLVTDQQERAAGTWMSHEDANLSVMMQVPEVGAFVRCLLPVHMTGGFMVTFGVWLGVHPDELHRAIRNWWAPEYECLELDGRLANRLAGWDLLAAPAHAAVRDPDKTPYVVSSADQLLGRVLAETWPHDKLLRLLDQGAQ